MIPICKEWEPKSFQKYRMQAQATYSGLSGKEKRDLRLNLLKEQGFICAYCMERIQNNPLKTKIEHWQSQESFSEEQLNYQNLLAVCKGNEGQPKKEQHCDSQKGSQKLSLNPSNPLDSSRMKISYQSDGTIISGDEIFNDEVNNVLNLNLASLRNNRRSTLEGIKRFLKSKNYTQYYIRRLLKKYNVMKEGKRIPYCGIAIHYLEKKVK